ncbi:MAG: hypothetical protein E7302_07540 [Butyrivibrio sp.]|nr:hypothetical protein [Butyrivibrio sp.]
MKNDAKALEVPIKDIVSSFNNAEIDSDKNVDYACECYKMILTLPSSQQKGIYDIVCTVTKLCKKKK